MDFSCPIEAADAFWGTVEVLLVHDAHASPEFGVSLEFDNDTMETVLCMHSTLKDLDDIFSAPVCKVLMAALEGHRMYDLMEDFVQSKPHTPLRWVCLSMLCHTAWFKPVGDQLMCRPALLKEIIKAIQFYVEAGPETSSINPFIAMPSTAAVLTVQVLLGPTGGGGVTGELAQLLDMGVMPALTSWLDALVSDRSLQTTETPSQDDIPGDAQKFCEPEEEPWGAFVSMRFSIQEAASCVNCLVGYVVATAGPSPAGTTVRSESPPDQHLALVSALLKPLQGLANGLGMAGLQVDQPVKRVLWFLNGSQESDIGAYVRALHGGFVLACRSGWVPSSLPEQLKTDAMAGVGMLCGSGLWPEDELVANELRAMVQEGDRGLPWKREMARRQNGLKAAVAQTAQKYQQAMRSLQSCSWLECPRTPAAAVAVGKAERVEFKKCSQCKIATYCSRTCQAEHWKNGHKKMCPKGLDTH